MEPRGDIIVVDDQPANLRLMEDMLRQQGYAVRSFPLGRMALGAAAWSPPDLILLDINMPEMDGFEVCRRLKSDDKLATIPVIFLSALNEAEDKIKAFRCGGMDYITKPFQFEEVEARVDIQLQIQRARRVERELLERTLTGAVKTLADLLQLTGPALSERSESIRGMMVHMAVRMGLEDAWQYELAGMLCLVGSMTLPAEVFERAYGGQSVAPEEDRMFRAHPATGSRLLSNIPRLEAVAKMIGKQMDSKAAQSSHAVDVGARMLSAAVEMDRQLFRGVPFKTALSHVKVSSRRYPAEILDALEDYSAPWAPVETRLLQVRELRPSMVADEPILTQDGKAVIVAGGTALTLLAIERIQNFAVTRGIRQPIRVRLPGRCEPELARAGLSAREAESLTC
jgi:CheY-like chemotaxis protein